MNDSFADGRRRGWAFACRVLVCDGSGESSEYRPVRPAAAWPQFLLPAGPRFTRRILPVLRKIRTYEKGSFPAGNVGIPSPRRFGRSGAAHAGAVPMAEPWALALKTAPRATAGLSWDDRPARGVYSLLLASHNHRKTATRSSSARRRRRAAKPQAARARSAMDVGSGTAAMPAIPLLVGNGAAVEPVFQLLSMMK